MFEPAGVVWSPLMSRPCAAPDGFELLRRKRKLKRSAEVAPDFWQTGVVDENVTSQQARPPVVEPGSGKPAAELSNPTMPAVKSAGAPALNNVQESVPPTVVSKTSQSTSTAPVAVLVQ